MSDFFDMPTVVFLGRGSNVDFVPQAGGGQSTGTTVLVYIDANDQDLVVSASCPSLQEDHDAGGVNDLVGAEQVTQ